MQNNNWEKLRIGDILKVKSGRDQKAVECKNGKYQILGTGGEIGRTNTFLYDKPSVLIGRKGTINKPMYKDKPFWTVDTLFYTEIKDGFSPKYVYYLFNTINWLRYNEASGVPSLTSSTIEKIKVKVPDLETQQKIVQILDLSNDTINKLENRIVIEKQKLNALCQKLIYSKKPNKKLENVAKSVNGYAFKSSDYAENGKYTILTIANVQKGEVDLNNASHLDAIPYDIRPWQKLEIGDIVISMTGNVGRVARIDKQNCLLNQRVGKIIPENINADYLYYLLSYVRFENRMRHQAQGGAQDNLSVKDINNFELYVPDDNVQNEISNCLNCQNKTIKLLKKNLENAKQQYKFLLNHLISGDFDLTNIKLGKGKE